MGVTRSSRDRNRGCVEGVAELELEKDRHEVKIEEPKKCTSVSEHVASQIGRVRGLA